MCINSAPEEDKGKNKRIITENFQSKLDYIDLYIQRIQHNLNGIDQATVCRCTLTFMEMSASLALKAGGKRDFPHMGSSVIIS